MLDGNLDMSKRSAVAWGLWTVTVALLVIASIYGSLIIAVWGLAISAAAAAQTVCAAFDEKQHQMEIIAELLATRQSQSTSNGRVRSVRERSPR